MAEKIKVKPEKPKGKPVKNKNWSDVKDYFKTQEYTDAQVDEAFGASEPKYATDIQMADAIRGLLNA